VIKVVLFTVEYAIAPEVAGVAVLDTMPFLVPTHVTSLVFVRVPNTATDDETGDESGSAGQSVDRNSCRNKGLLARPALDCVVVGAAVVGAAVTGAAIVGLAVTGAAVTGAAVVGAAVVGAAVTGAAVVGMAVTGTAVVGAAVTGAAVVGAADTGATVVGATVVGAGVGPIEATACYQIRQESKYMNTVYIVSRYKQLQYITRTQC
jgi:hypothetical protein